MLGGMARPRLEAVQFVPDTEPVLLVGLADCMAASGIAGERLCQGMGFDVAALRAGHLVSRRQAWRMIRRAMRLSGRPDLGLDVGASPQDYGFGLPRQAMSDACDLAEAISLGLRFQSQCGSMLDLSGVELDDGCLALVATTELKDPLVVRFLVDELFSSLRVLGRELAGQAIVPSRVELAFQKPAYAERYLDAFGAAPVFGTRQHRFVLDPDTLHRPLREGRELRTATHWLGELQQRENAPPRSIVQALEQVLRQTSPMSLSIEDAAGRLGLSARTLRRRLQELGTSYRSVIDDVRAELAEWLMREQGMSLARVSERLGFSEVRAFRHAFQRWHGTTARDREGMSNSGHRGEAGEPGQTIG